MADTADLVVDEELARTTTRRLVGVLETAALAVQAACIAISVVIDQLTFNGQVLLGLVMLLHLLAAFGTHKTAGPLARGGPWMALWLGLIVLIPLVMAHLVGADEYGSSPACVQLCTYPMAPLAMLAFYPWWRLGRTSLRPIIEYGILAVAVLEPLALILYLHRPPVSVNYVSAGTTALINVLAYIIGKAVGQMCAVAAQAQVQLEHQNFDEFFRRLHIDFRNHINLIRSSIGNPALVEEHIDEIEEIIRKGRADMLLVQQRVPLAVLLGERLAMFEKHLIIAGPQIGGIRVRREVALILDQAVADLLTNAVSAGATEVRVDFNVDKNEVTQLDIADNGPDFPCTVFDDPSKSLSQLRVYARELSGDLVKVASQDGAHLRLTVPLRPPREQQKAKS